MRVAAIARPAEQGGDDVTEADRLHALFDAHFDFVWRSLCRLGLPEHVADDAAQRVFVIASRRLPDIEAGSERAFLFRTALRVACEERRAIVRRREVLCDEAPENGEGPAQPDELLDQRRARELLDRILQSLPFDLRTVLVLFEFEGLSIDEIAETVGIPRGTAASRLRRAREEFTDAVSRWLARHDRGGR
jgi:RNA polymerase sigma-70 factor (ECF subfamily)